MKYHSIRWINHWKIKKTGEVVPAIPRAIMKVSQKNVCLPALS